ncbi:hypothetical protein J6T21_00700 [Candidatus Saccharibacteria bacterium]|nr:hypothetical protein [Candidatus Saccharibacteria bacterium]
MVEKNEQINTPYNSTSDFDQLQTEEFDPEKAERLKRRQELVAKYMEEVRKATDDQQTIVELNRGAESAAEILVNPALLKKLREKHIREIKGEAIEKDIEYLIVKRMDTEFTRSSEYLEYCKEEMPEIYDPDTNEAAKYIAPFLEKTGEEMTLYALECAAKKIAKGDISEGVLRTVKIISSKFVLNMPEEVKVNLEEDSISTNESKEIAAFYNRETNPICLNKPLEFFKKEFGPIGTVAAFAHEVFHAFQHHIKENGNGSPKAKEYAQNFENYIHISVDPELYYKQLVELEAYVFQNGIIEQLNSTKKEWQNE